MNEIYAKYNAVKKECEYWQAEYEALKGHYELMKVEVEEAEKVRLTNDELAAMVKRLTSELEMLKECVVRMTMELLGVS